MGQTQGQRIGYARVSSTDQNLARQIDALGDVDKLFTDEVSGTSRTKRDGLTAMLDYVRDGDVVLVASMDRLARSVRDLIDLVEEITHKGAALSFLKEGQTYRPDSTDPMAKLMLSMLGAIAEFERELIHERQAEGIAAAKKRGVYARRRPQFTPEQVGKIKALADMGVPKTKIAAEIGISRAAVYRVLDGTYSSSKEDG